MASPYDQFYFRSYNAQTLQPNSVANLILCLTLYVMIEDASKFGDI